MMPVIEEGEEDDDAAEDSTEKLDGLDGTIFDLEKYLDRAILADMGAYCPEAHWARQTLEELRVYNDYFNAFSMASLRDCVININSFNKASWNRTIQLLNLLTRNTFAFLVLSILLDWQMPVDDSSCSRQASEESCYNRSPAMPNGIHYCGWEPQRNLCHYDRGHYLDIRLIVMTILLGAVLVAPVSLVLDHFMWYLMVDLEADPQFRHTALEDDDSEDSDSDVDEYSEHSKRQGRHNKKRRATEHHFEDQLARKVSMSRKMTLSGKVAPLEEGKSSLADEMEYLERVKKNKKAKKKTISEARVIAEQAREASELTHVADSSTLLGRRLVIEESLTKMRLVFMIERIKQQKALDKERRKIVKKKWQYLLPRFTKQQRTARSLENVVEYVELRDKRLEVSSVLEKLDREDKTLQKAKTNQEKFRETMGRFVHIPLAYETQVDKLELLGDLMADIREYRELLEPGVEPPPAKGLVRRRTIA